MEYYFPHQECNKLTYINFHAIAHHMPVRAHLYDFFGRIWWKWFHLWLPFPRAQAASSVTDITLGNTGSRRYDCAKSKPYHWYKYSIRSFPCTIRGNVVSLLLWYCYKCTTDGICSIPVYILTSHFTRFIHLITAPSFACMGSPMLGAVPGQQLPVRCRTKNWLLFGARAKLIS